MHPLEQLRDDALREIEAARDEKSLEGVRVKYLGKSGSISEWGERMKTLGKEDRFRERHTTLVLCIRFIKCTSAEFRFLDEWALRSPKVLMSKLSGTASML